MAKLTIARLGQQEPAPTAPNLERLLLADDEMLAATVAWPALDRSTEEAPNLQRWAEGIWYSPQQWMHAAGLRLSQAAPIAERLRVLGFISAEGEAWEPVLQLARAKAGRRLKGR